MHQWWLKLRKNCPTKYVCELYGFFPYTMCFSLLVSTFCWASYYQRNEGFSLARTKHCYSDRVGVLYFFFLEQRRVFCMLSIFRYLACWLFL